MALSTRTRAIAAAVARDGHRANARLGEITEEQFDAAFSLNARGTLFTVQKALPLFNDGGSILLTGSNASLRGCPNWSVYAASKAVLPAYARVWVSELRDRKRSRQSRCSSPRTSRATSMAWNWSSTAEPRSSDRTTMAHVLEWAGVLLVGPASNGAGFDIALEAEAH
jgi:short-subunit dehydrogenase